MNKINTTLMVVIVVGLQCIYLALDSSPESVNSITLMELALQRIAEQCGNDLFRRY